MVELFPHGDGELVPCGIVDCPWCGKHVGDTPTDIENGEHQCSHCDKWLWLDDHKVWKMITAADLKYMQWRASNAS